MEKLAMREYLAELETRVDLALKKWKKESRIENGEVVQLEWQFELAHVIMDIFWHDEAEHINVNCLCPRMTWKNEWQGLTKETATRVMDRISNFAQIVQNKPH